ncbi:hypothetical protein GQ457_17G006210 [Hibiscus cannabinus]
MDSRQQFDAKERIIISVLNYKNPRNDEGSALCSRKLLKNMVHLQPLIFFILAAFPFMFISPSLSCLDHDKVTLSLYYETLCPYCASFISNDLVMVFQTDLYTIVNLRLVPWGNAHIVGDMIQCQHGEDECYLNAIHSCVIHLWPDVKTHFDFIRCTEEKRFVLKEGPENRKEAMWRNCSDQLGLRADMINKCYSTGIGLKLLLQHGDETENLKPPHEYVPWVVVNNAPLKDVSLSLSLCEFEVTFVTSNFNICFMVQDYENFVKSVCDAYQDNNVTEAQSRIKSKKVNLSLYYESLCPYCRSFIVSQLVKVFNTDLLNIINLRLVPWGNAQYVEPNKTIICQHGEDECYLNTIHACAINIWPDPRKHFNFIYCVENQGLHVNDNQHSNGADAVWKACSAASGMDQKLINNCYDSGYGRKASFYYLELNLLLRYATETDNLRPKHLFVPWVTVNNQPLYDVRIRKLCSLCLQRLQRQSIGEGLPVTFSSCNRREILDFPGLLPRKKIPKWREIEATAWIHIVV